MNAISIGQTLYTVLIAVFGSAASVAAINAYSQRKKISAEGTRTSAETFNIQMEAALKQVTAALKRAEISDTEVAKIQETIRSFRKALYLHQVWDAEVYQALLRSGNTTVSPPPEIWI